MARPLRVDPAALAELEHASRVVDESRELGDELLIAFHKATVSICAKPEAHAAILRTRSGHDVRAKILGRFRYRIVFVDLPRVVWVIAFAHARQRPLYWTERLGDDSPA